MMQKVLRFLKKPMVQRVLAWAIPVLIGWVLSKFDKKAEQRQRLKNKKR